MEDQLWAVLYPLVRDQDKRRHRRKRVQFADADILLLALWAILHDRPICWGCRRCNWPADHTRDLPSPATMSRRLKTVSVQTLLEQVFYRLLSASVMADRCLLCRRFDSKPLVVSGFTKDRDACRRGYATGGLAKGYKLFGCWAKSGVVPETLVLGPMNRSDPDATMHLIDRLEQLHGGAGTVGGYLLADVADDTNTLHEYAGGRGLQLVAPRKQPGSGLGHCDHSPHRLRAIEILEGPDPSLRLATSPSAYRASLLSQTRRFGRSLYALRGQIERDYGNAGSFGGGLQPLPNFVRRPRRVALWVIGKLIINGIRICQKHGLTP